MFSPIAARSMMSGLSRKTSVLMTGPRAGAGGTEPGSGASTDVSPKSTVSSTLAITGDIDVTVSRPINVGYTIHPGDQIQSHGTSYGTTQIVENFYFLTSTAQGSAIQAAKMITADIGIYPQQLRIPQ